MFFKLQNFQINKKLFYILALTAFLILVRISQVDLTGDNAHYAIRSIGYVDTMFSDAQTTPLYWFDKYPWWADLSFHDHPPLLFLVQHIFLSVRESLFFAKLPYILFSLGTIIMIYFLARDKYGEKIGFWSALLLSLNSLFIWTTKTAYMEAGVVFFIALTLFFFLRFLKDKRYWLPFGIALGLSFLSKYNSFFLVPTFLSYILLWRRDLLKQKYIYAAMLVTVAVILPVIVYNVMMYQATGHMDYQFSRLFGMESPWRAGGVELGTFNPLSLFRTLGLAVSFPYLALSFAGLVYALYKREMKIVALAILFLTVMFLITGGNVYHLSIYNIFLALPLAYLVVGMKDWCKIARHKAIYGVLSVILIVYFGFLVINSSIFGRQFFDSHKGWLASSAQSQNFGIFQLDSYLEKLIKENNIIEIRDGYGELKNKKESLARKYGSSQRALQRDTDEYPQMIVYDNNLNWFAELWPFKRRRFYHNLPILSTDEYLRFGGQIKIGTIFFLKATDKTFLEGERIRDKISDKIEAVMIEQGVEPEYVYRNDGEIAFKVYKKAFSL